MYWTYCEHCKQKTLERKAELKMYCEHCKQTTGSLNEEMVKKIRDLEREL